MNDRIEVLKIIKEKQAKDIVRTKDINLDILLSQSTQNIRTILESSGEKQWRLIKLFSSEIFYYVDQEYQQQVIEVLTDKEISEKDAPIIVKRALTDTLMKRKDGIKFIQAVKGFTKRNKIVNITFQMLDNKYLVEREDALELFKLLGEEARNYVIIELILKKLENKELAQLPNLRELLAPILSSKTNMYILTRVLGEVYQNKNALKFIKAISIGNHPEQKQIAAELVLDKAIRCHKKGVRLVGTCANARGGKQAEEIRIALKNNKILHNKNVVIYMKIMASARKEKNAMIIRKMIEERVKGTLSALSEKEFRKVLKEIAKCKDSRNCNQMGKVVFDFFYNKEEKEEGLFEYAMEVLRILKTTNPRLLRYTYDAIYSLYQQQERKVDFVKAISTSKIYTETEYANELLNNPCFMKDKNALRYIQLLTRIEEKKVSYMYEIMSKEELRKKEDGYEFIEEISKSRDIDSVDVLVEEYPEIPLSLLKEITQATYPASDCCNQIIRNQKIKNPLPLVREIAKINDYGKVTEITDSIMELTEIKEIMEKENPERILLPIVTAQSEDHRNYLRELLHNKEMLQKDNLVELETKLESCKKEELGVTYSELTGESISTISSYQPFPTLNNLSRMITFLTNESDPERVINEMVSKSKNKEESPAVKMKRLPGQ